MEKNITNELTSQLTDIVLEDLRQLELKELLEIAINMGVENPQVFSLSRALL